MLINTLQEKGLNEAPISNKEYTQTFKHSIHKPLEQTHHLTEMPYSTKTGLDPIHQTTTPQEETRQTVTPWKGRDHRTADSQKWFSKIWDTKKAWDTKKKYQFNPNSNILNPQYPYNTYYPHYQDYLYQPYLYQMDQPPHTIQKPLEQEQSNLNPTEDENQTPNNDEQPRINPVHPNKT